MKTLRKSLPSSEYLRDAIDDVSAIATSFDEFQKLLLEKYKISVIDKRGRYSFHHPDRTQPISERAIKQNTKYYKNYLAELKIVASNVDAILEQPLKFIGI